MACAASALRRRFDRARPEVRRIGVLYLPVALGLIVTQAQVSLDLALQKHRRQAAPRWLYSHARLPVAAGLRGHGDEPGHPAHALRADRARVSRDADPRPEGRGAC